MWPSANARPCRSPVLKMMFVGVALVVRLSGIGAIVTVWLLSPFVAVCVMFAYSFVLKVLPPSMLVASS